VKTHSETRQKFLDYNSARNRLERRYRDFRNELKYVSRLKALSTNIRLLDVGCGPGLLTEFWNQHGVEGIGIDIDPSLARIAKERFQKNGMKAKFIVGRVEELPYKEGVFDICIANAILEHVQDWRATLTDVTRVLRNGGLLVFSTTNKLHPFQREINHFPFYPWIPDRLKKTILENIMKRRPDLVNYTENPAIHWFSYEKLKSFLHGLGYDVFTRLDLIQKSDLKGWKATSRFVLGLVQDIHLLRYLYYFYSLDVSVYAIKRGRHFHKVGQ
jgi:2-polyprenyl-3-methyl-5-hydroxy-6-metoxy-1,4-benzoquinol methylase